MQDAGCWLLAGVLVIGGAVAGSAKTEGLAPAAPGETGAARLERLNEVQGSVEAIDRQVKWVRVSGGAPGRAVTTLQFATTSEVMVQGRTGSIDDLREGDRVRVSYEDRHGIRLVHRIEVLPGI